MYLPKEHETELGNLIDSTYYVRSAAKREKQPDLSIELYFSSIVPWRTEEWNRHALDVGNANLSMGRRIHHFDHLGLLLWEEITRYCGEGRLTTEFKKWMDAGGT